MVIKEQNDSALESVGAIMDIKAGFYAYYFPNKNSLENFIRQHKGQIDWVKGMLSVYSKARYNTYNFSYRGHKFYWQYASREYYERIEYEIIMPSFQRTE